jgi:hypothetical protein
MSKQRFARISGGMTLYTDEGESVRFCLAHYGEDARKVVEAFWKERKEGDFVIVPVFAYGPPPRKEFCTKESVAEAFKHGGENLLEEEHWVNLLRHFGIAINALKPWPKAEVIPLERGKAVL